MTSKRRLVVPFVCNCVIPVGVILTALTYIVVPIIIFHSTDYSQTEDSIANHEDICIFVDHIVSENLTCMDVAIQLQNNSISSIIPDTDVIIALECRDKLLYILCLCSDYLIPILNDSFATMLLKKICLQDDLVQCADGFYQENSTCLPSCSSFRELDDSTAEGVLILYFIGFCLSAVICTLYLMMTLIKRKELLKFPAILFTFSLLSFIPHVLCSLISLIGGQKIFCSKESFVQAIQNPSIYCIISGILSASVYSTTWFLLVMVLVLFWKLQFPFYARRYHICGRKVLTFVILIGLFIPLPYVVISLSSKDSSFIPVLYPATKCVSRNVYLNFYYFNGVGFSIPLAAAASLLILTLTQLQKNFGICFWKNKNAVSAAEIKILVLALITSILLGITGFAYNQRIINTPKFYTSLFTYFICELFGSQETTSSCNKEQLQGYSAPVVYAVADVTAAITVPLAYLLTIIHWANLTQWIKLKVMQLCSPFISKRSDVELNAAIM